MNRIETIDQFLPTLAEGDATANHARQVRRLLHDLGYRSELFVERTAPGLEGRARHFTEHQPRPGSAVLYQFAIGSVMTEPLLASDVPLALNFHNLTPAELYEPWELGLAHGLWWGRHQVAQLAARTDLGIAVSAFNATDLVAAGYRETVVAPIILDAGTFAGGVDEGLVGELSGGGSAWLFVGRLAPNKAQHDLVKAFALYRRVFDPGARLWLVGGSSSDAYLRAVRGLVSALGLEGAVRLAGSVSAEELAAYYRAADVFVCASDHEGFCVPLLEAMHHGLPVVAYASSAVPETLGGAGVCLPEKSPGVVAAAVWRVVADAGVRRALVAAGRRRLADFAPERTRATFAAAVERFVQAAA
jgi:glycosyltransferase involved in cell wall biosynthesis